MPELFKQSSIYINKARFAAILWTLLILFLCFIPGHDLPNINVPLIDKWAHILLFGVFSFLWHCTTPTKSFRYKLILLLITGYLGWLVEYVQGHYIPDRSQDNLDSLADIIGGVCGILVYTLLYYKYQHSD